MTKLENLNINLEKAYEKFSEAEFLILREIQQLTGCNNLISNYFPGEGLGIGVDSADPSLTPIQKIIDILKKQGSITVGEILENCSL